MINPDCCNGLFLVIKFTAIDTFAKAYTYIFQGWHLAHGTIIKEIQWACLCQNRQPVVHNGLFCDLVSYYFLWSSRARKKVAPSHFFLNVYKITGLSAITSFFFSRKHKLNFIGTIFAIFCTYDDDFFWARYMDCIGNAYCIAEIVYSITTLLNIPSLLSIYFDYINFNHHFCACIFILICCVQHTNTHIPNH